MTKHKFNGGQFAPACSRKSTACTTAALDELTTTQIAKLLGVSNPVLITVRPYLAGFPKPRRAKDKMNYFSAAGVKKWLNGRDVAEVAQMIRDTYAAARHTRARQYSKTRDSAMDHGQAKAFLAGGFMTAEQREQLKFKKLVARTTKPKTTRVTVVPDWMRE